MRDRPHARIRLVNERDLDIDVIAQHVTFLAIERKPVQYRERIRRNRRAEPLDRIAVIIVVRRLDQKQRKLLRANLIWHLAIILSVRIRTMTASPRLGILWHWQPVTGEIHNAAVGESQD